MPRRRLLGAVLVTAAVLAGGPAASAAGAGPSTSAGVVPSPTGPVGSAAATSTTSSTVAVTVPPAGTPVDNLQLNAITAQFVADVKAEAGAARASLALAQTALQRADAAQVAAGDVVRATTDRLDHLDLAERSQAARLQAATSRLRDLAIDAYVSGGPAAPLEDLLSSGNINDFARRQGYLSTVASEGSDALRGYTAARNASSRAALSTVDDLQGADARLVAAGLDVQAAQAKVNDANTVLADRQALLTLTSDAVTTPDTDIPRMVLDAYQRAAATVQAEGCHLAWWGLAGIGKVESDHGRDQNAHLAPNGDLVPHIVGVPLTGQNGTVLVQDASGAFSHAEGPMQFLPSTWQRWGQDGNGDGVKDIDNIYDATLGAATYLCATSHDLETDDGLKAAYHSYNHSDDYVTEVLALAKAYEAADAAGFIPSMTPVALWALAPPTTTTTTTTSTTTPDSTGPSVSTTTSTLP